MWRLLERLFRWMVMGLAWVMPILAQVVWFLLRLGFTSFAAWLRGVPLALDGMAHEWQNRAMALGVPTEYENWVYWGAYGVAILVVGAGWIVASYVTVGLLWLIF